MEKGHVVSILECIENDDAMEVTDVCVKLMKALCDRFSMAHSELLKFPKFRAVLEKIDSESP